jgi:3-methyladenine DNA glycosylase/8-oxoguanine DNA glycosylase
MQKKELERIKIINILINSDNKLGKFIKYFEKENFIIQDDYKKRSDFLSLIRIIIGQQLSITAASSIFEKFTLKFGENINFINSTEFNENELKYLGLSKAKANTILELSKSIKNNQLDLNLISKMEESKAKKILCEFKGIGPWTVENFLIFTGNNQDICPANDLGIKKGIQKIYKLDNVPSDEEVYSISEKWRPYRSLAVRYIWEVVDQNINF